VKRYEDMKLRILNMSHSTIAGLGVLLGYRGPYAIYRAMQDQDLRQLIDRVISIVIRTVEAPAKLAPQEFARDTIERLNNPNIPDDPMRIAFTGSTKMQPRFMDTYYAAQAKGLSAQELQVVLLPVAGFLRYTMGIDDTGAKFAIESDPIKEALVACASQAQLGVPASAAAFADLIARPGVMGKNLFEHGDTGERLTNLVAKMLAGPGAVRKTLQECLANP
jgi:fructuronate reductase